MCCGIAASSAGCEVEASNGVLCDAVVVLALATNDDDMVVNVSWAGLGFVAVLVLCPPRAMAMVQLWRRTAVFRPCHAVPAVSVSAASFLSGVRRSKRLPVQGFTPVDELFFGGESGPSTSVRIFDRPKNVSDFLSDVSGLCASGFD